MLGMLIIALMCIHIYATAKPIQMVKEAITKRVNNQYFTQLISCNKCSTFWIAPFLWVAIPLMTPPIIFIITLTSIVTLLEWVYLRYLE